VKFTGLLRVEEVRDSELLMTSLTKLKINFGKETVILSGYEKL
jgi:hypothetical protein